MHRNVACQRIAFFPCGIYAQAQKSSLAFQYFAFVYRLYRAACARFKVLELQAGQAPVVKEEAYNKSLIGRGAFYAQRVGIYP
jgi:hypothetical protein